MSENPYQSTAAMSGKPANSAHDQSFELVSQGKRFINYLIDRVLMTIGAIALGVMFGVSLAIFDPEGAVVEDNMIDVVGNIIGFAFVFLYFVFFESIFQRSPGKFATGTKVIDQAGGAPTFGQIVGRSACRFIPFEAFSFLFGDSARVVGWHDKLSGTRVVEA